MVKIAPVLVDESAEDLLFSDKFACIQCGVSYPEITPRMFSFNNPHGACPKCDGIGAKLFFDPDLIVPNDELSLRQGYRLLSAYVSSAGEKFWIITEADRSATTVLLPEDYQEALMATLLVGGFYGHGAAADAPPENDASAPSSIRSGQL